MPGWVPPRKPIMSKAKLVGLSKAATKHGKSITKSVAKRGGFGLAGKLLSKGRSKSSKFKQRARKAAGAKRGSGVGRAALRAHKAAKRAGPARKAAVVKKKRVARRPAKVANRGRVRAAARSAARNAGKSRGRG